MNSGLPIPLLFAIFLLGWALGLTVIYLIYEMGED